MATWPPLLRPYSAVVLPVSTLNSASESGFVRSGAKLEPPALVSLTSIPSSVKFQERSRAPFTWTPPPVLAPDTTPGCVVTSESGLRPRVPTMGSVSTAFWSMTLPRFPDVLSCTSSPPATTCTLSASVPVSSVALRVVGSPMRTMFPVDTKVLNPWISTFTV